MKLMPFFMTNDAWYTYDDENEMWVLTDKAPLRLSRVTRSITQKTMCTL